MNKAVTMERIAAPTVTQITGWQAFMVALWAANLCFFAYAFFHPAN